MKADFISRVMQIMNELGWDETGSNAFIGSDKTKVEQHIESVFTDAWRKAAGLLPKIYFNIKEFASNRHVANTDTGTGYIYLPGDFHLLYSFRMAGWKKPAETLIESSDPLMSIQSNEFTRGNFVRPVCAKTMRSAGGYLAPVLEYYSLPKGVEHKITEALYIPVIAPLNEAKINEKLFAPLAYLCASMVFTIFEKPDIAQVLENKAIEIK